MPRNPLVLLVDYDPKNLRALSELFTSSGYQVETATDGLAALRVFKEKRPDIVLLEAMIPKKHGFEVCQEIKKTPEGKTTPVLIMTAVYKGRKHRSEAMHVRGCDGYVEKPCAPGAILELVMSFVPPQPDAVQVHPSGRAQHSASASGEKRGEVIPFPSGRASRSAVPDALDLSDPYADAEREIMSRLDEILPDTPLFNAVATGEGTPTSASAASAAVDLQVELEETVIEEPETDDGTGEIHDEPEQLAKATAAEQPPSDGPEQVASRPMPPSQPPPIPALKPFTAPTSSSRSSVSPALIVSLGIALVAVFLWWLSGL